jgi:hypothetical protein
MPLREPRLEQDRLMINNLLGWSGVSIASIASFVMNINPTESLTINSRVIYNRGKYELEDTERRSRDCWMISIWDSEIENVESECLFQQPIPIKVRYAD